MPPSELTINTAVYARPVETLVDSAGHLLYKGDGNGAQARRKQPATPQFSIKSARMTLMRV